MLREVTFAASLAQSVSLNSSLPTKGTRGSGHSGHRWFKTAAGQQLKIPTYPRIARWAHGFPAGLTRTGDKLVEQAAQAPHVAGGADAGGAPPVVRLLFLVRGGAAPHREHLWGLEGVGAAGATGGGGV